MNKEEANAELFRRAGAALAVLQSDPSRKKAMARARQHLTHGIEAVREAYSEHDPFPDEPDEPPEFPIYVGSDGKEHGEF